MLGTTRGRKDQATSNAHSGIGFTLLELLMVTIVLGVLAAIVVSRIGNVVGESATATCLTTSKTVNEATAFYLQEHVFTTQVTRSELTVGPNRVIQSWPTDSNFQISLAGDSNGFVGMTSADSPPVVIEANDVVVRVGTSFFDATRDPLGACKQA